MQRVRSALSQGVDEVVKTLYSAPPSLVEHVLSSKGFIVKSRRNVIRTNRPVMGPVAFVRAAAMKLHGTCGAAAHWAYPASLGQLDRDEDSWHPGEGGA